MSADKKMLTIAFHSYKGGVGRSMALANIGVALAKTGNKTVLLDLDIDAPGLHLKFGVGDFARGYVDYLREIYADPIGGSRAPRPARGTRIEKLRAIALTPKNCGSAVADNLRIVPAGNPSSQSYWDLLSGDPWLYSVFASHEGRGAEAEDIPKAEREVLSGIFEDESTQYLLVDCKSAGLYSKFVLSNWADIVVAMFPANNEGHLGAVQSYRMASAGRRDSPSMVPVVCRVPETITPADRTRLFNGFTKYLTQNGITLERRSAPLGVLHEYRELEIKEQILLARKSSAKNEFVDVMLSHDYVRMLYHILPEGPPRPEGGTWREKDLKKALGLADDVQILERVLNRMHDGRLVEAAQGEYQVQFRAATIRGLMHALADEPTELTAARRKRYSTILASRYHDAGQKVGRNFGETRAWSTPRRSNTGTATKIRQSLVEWCAFDMDCGFGKLTLKFYDGNARRGALSWTANFLLASKDDRASTLPDYMKSFEIGYLKGVIERLLNVAPGELVVESADHELFKFHVLKDKRGQKESGRTTKRKSANLA